MNSAVQNHDISSSVRIFETDNATDKKRWIFRVKATGLDPSETVCVTGDCNELGNWKYTGVIRLERENTTDIWSAPIDVPLRLDVSYRYCVCIFNPDTRQVLVRRWETHPQARKIKATCIKPPETFDLFGEHNGKIKIDNVWITAGHLLQLRFYNDPLTLYRDNNESDILTVKLNAEDSTFVCDRAESSASYIENNTNQAKNVIVEVASLKQDKCLPTHQEAYGISFAKDDYLIFNISVCSSESDLMYTINFYKRRNGDWKSKPDHVGYAQMSSNIFETTEGDFKIPIICTSLHRPIGTMHGEYLTIYPMRNSNCTFEKSFLSYWKETWKNLDVGHRGLGSSFKEERNIVRENTIASLKMAGANGADMVEFDVQLSKDLIPVINHDFDVCVVPKNRGSVDKATILTLPLKDLTLAQLRTFKLYHTGEDPDNERFHDEDLSENQPFSLLTDLFEKIDTNIGFNIEIKWPMMAENRATPLEHSFDMNMYTDKIIEVVLKCGGTRKIFFSCFHPSVCAMVRAKQNKYPVMFLTSGVNTKWPKLLDPRCNTIRYAVNNALNSNLIGIVVYSEDILRDPSQLKLAENAKLIVFCWGEDNNNKDVIKNMKALGIHGVIFDRMDKYSSKTVKESRFLIDDREENTTK